jgi:hypothetical protein
MRTQLRSSSKRKIKSKERMQCPRHQSLKAHISLVASGSKIPTPSSAPLPAVLGGHLKTIPDGETGPRKQWAYWQFTVIEQDPNLEPDPDQEPRPFPMMTEGVPGEVQIRLASSTSTWSILKEATNARIATASKYVKNFGVATECGLGRIMPTDIEPLMQIHADCSAPVG